MDAILFAATILGGLAAVIYLFNLWTKARRKSEAESNSDPTGNTFERPPPTPLDRASLVAYNRCGPWCLCAMA